jgi:diphthamide biosynthesis protein 4
LKFQQCVEAANCLLDPQSKARYDAVALGKQMIDITGRISETCSLKEDFECEEQDSENETTTVTKLFTRECRCGGIYSVVWDVHESSATTSTKKRKYSTCDSCSLVVEVLCDV